MQIAVCLSGAERLESNAVTLFARHLPATADIDCFCFVWEGGPLSDEAALTELLARKTEGRFRSIKVKVGRNFSPNLSMTIQKYPETNPENVLRMYQAIRQCNDMKLRHEVQAGLVYDCVVRSRTDLQLSSEIAFERFLPMIRDFIVFPDNGHWRGGLNDQFAFSSSANMDAYSSVFDYINDHCNSGCVFHPETLLRFHLQKMGKPIVMAPLSSILIRE